MRMLGFVQILEEEVYLLDFEVQIEVLQLLQNDLSMWESRYRLAGVDVLILSMPLLHAPQ